MIYRWKYFTAFDCPVCGGKRNDCRQSLITNLVHCRHVEANPRDYHYLKQDSLGFGMWQSIADRESWANQRKGLSEFEFEQRRLEYLRQKRENEKRIARKYKQSMSICDRDREIRKILSQLELFPVSGRTKKKRTVLTFVN